MREDDSPNLNPMTVQCKVDEECNKATECQEGCQIVGDDDPEEGPCGKDLASIPDEREPKRQENSGCEQLPVRSVSDCLQEKKPV